MKRRYLIILPLLILVVFMGSGPKLESDGTVNQELLEIFDYELQNRAFARGTFEVILADDGENPKRRFFEAFYELEMITQKKYAPYAKKYDLDTEARWWTRVRTRLGLIAIDLAGDRFMKMMHNATIKYVSKLEKLPVLSPEEDRDFFEFVVAQEIVQANAVGYLVEGDLAKAIATINDFVLKQDQAQGN